MDTGPPPARKDDGLSLRLGALYMLREILRVSEALQWPCLDILTAYLDKHCFRIRWDEPDGWPQFEPPPDYCPDFAVSDDILAACSAIGARRIVDPSRTVGLFSLQLWWVSFRDANLRHVSFAGSDLHEADFDGADLRHCDFSSTNLERQQIEKATVDTTTTLPWHTST